MVARSNFGRFRQFPAMNCIYGITCFYLLILSSMSSGKDSNPCNVQGSSDSDLYVVECSTRSQMSPDKLLAIIKSLRVHGEENVTAVNLEKVDELRLNGPIKLIPHRAFAWVPNLKRLIIDTHSSNTSAPIEIETHETSFSGLDNLISLTLITKFISESIVPSEAFPDSLRSIGPKLQQLTIQDAELKGELSKKTMQYFPNLRELAIFNSPKLKLSNDPGAFGVNSQLRKLDLKQISMEKYPNSLASLKNLKFLRLENVQLTELPSGAFTNFASTLSELHIDNNPLTFTPPHLLRDMNSLKTVTLSGNKLKQLPEKMFSDLSKVDELNVSGNQLESLPDHLFDNATRLVKLDLSKNRLANISRGTLSGLEQNLLHLDLSDNRIRSLYGAGLNSQLGLSLASNEIDELESGFFESGSSFSRLILSSNPLRRIEVGAFSGVEIGSGNLYIQRANFTRLDLAVFHGMKSKRGADEQAQIIVSNCPELVDLNVSRYSVQWPSGVRQIVFTNNPKFVPAEPNNEGSDLIRFLRKTEVQFVFDGYGLCDCRWNWLRTGKFANREARTAVVDFGYFEESSPSTCCNIPGMAMEDFLVTKNFEKHCNGTRPLTAEAKVEMCPNFDASSLEEPEARKKR